MPWYFECMPALVGHRVLSGSKERSLNIEISEKEKRIAEMYRRLKKKRRETTVDALPLQHPT